MESDADSPREEERGVSPTCRELLCHTSAPEDPICLSVLKITWKINITSGSSAVRSGRVTLLLPRKKKEKE